MSLAPRSDNVFETQLAKNIHRTWSTSYGKDQKEVRKKNWSS